MFERYTEKASRTIFFARYEASVFGASSIEPHHILLAILRERPALFQGISAEGLREEIEHEFLRGPEVPTSEDLPLNNDSQFVLRRAAEQADALGQRRIECEHLLLGLLAPKESFVAKLLHKNGMDEAFVLQRIRSDADLSDADLPGSEAGAFFRPFVLRLTALGREARIHLPNFTQEDSGHPMQPNGWSRREALGHLIDWATTNHHWLAQALAEARLNAAAYPAKEWVAAQKYQEVPWEELVEIWLLLNSLLTHVMSRIPEEKATTPCRVGSAGPVPLFKLAADYAAYCDNLLSEIFRRR